MSGLFERIGKVVQAEWTSRVGGKDDGEAPPPRADAVPARTTAASRRPDVDSAWRMLELEPGASLDEVREAYHRLGRRYHPRTLDPAHAAAARTVVDALTEAYEVLEEHLLPLPDEQGPPSA